MTKSRRSACALLMAAGRSERFGGDLPKQFLELAGEPMLIHSIRAFSSTDEVDSIVVVLPQQRPAFVDEAIGLPKVVSVAAGGATRQASLGRGLVCVPDETSVVVVHDAARPLVRPALIRSVLEGLGGSFDGIICGLAVEDALKEVSRDHEILRSRSRGGLWRAQTPQAFAREPLEGALARADAEGIACDDCSELLTRAGYRVGVVPGDPWNLKATGPEDLALLESLLARRALREGETRR